MAINGRSFTAWTGARIQERDYVSPIITDPMAILDTEYSELPGSPHESMTDKGFTVRRTLITTWANRLVLARKFKGGIQLAANVWHYSPAHFWKDVPECMVTNVDMSPFDERPMADAGDSRFAGYKMAQLEVTYETPQVGSGPDSYTNDKGEQIIFSEDIEPHAEFITLPNSRFFWKEKAHRTQKDEAQTEYDTDIAVPVGETESPQKIVRTFAWVYTRHQMPVIPAFMFDFIGKVNEKEVTSRTLGFTFPKWTLLFDEPKLSRDYTASGYKGWKVSMRMIYRPTTWQKFWRSGKKEPEYMYILDPAMGDMSDTSNDERLATYVIPYYPYQWADFLKIQGA